MIKLADLLKSRPPVKPADETVFTRVGWAKRPWEMGEQAYLASLDLEKHTDWLAVWEAFTGEEIRGDMKACEALQLAPRQPLPRDGTAYTTTRRAWNHKQAQRLHQALVRRALRARIAVPVAARPLWALTVEELFQRAGLGKPRAEHARSHAGEVLSAASEGEPVPADVLAWARGVAPERGSRSIEIPRVLWYGTSLSLSRITSERSSTHPSHVGVWLTASRAAAETFAQLATRRWADRVPWVLEVETRARRPIVFENYRAYLDAWQEADSDARKLRRRLSRQGYDAVIIFHSTTDMDGPPRVDVAVLDPDKVVVVGRTSIPREER